MRTKINSVVAGTALIAASVAAGQSPRQAPIFDVDGVKCCLKMTGVTFSG